jgi:hypothetical protein
MNTTTASSGTSIRITPTCTTGTITPDVFQPPVN